MKLYITIFLYAISTSPLFSMFGPIDRFYGPRADTPHQIINSVAVGSMIAGGLGLTIATGTPASVGTTALTSAPTHVATTTISAKTVTAGIIAKIATTGIAVTTSCTIS